MNKYYTIGNIDAMKVIISEIVKMIDDYNYEIVKSNQKIKYEKNILALLVNRMKLNLKGVEVNLDNFKVFESSFLPIAHLSRALTTDYLNYYYLQLFYNEDESSDDFINEMKLFDRDLFDTMTELNRIENQYRNNGKENKEEVENKQKKIERKFPDILQTGKVKSPSALRNTSKFLFPEKFKYTPVKGFSEKYKYRFLKEMDKLKQGGAFIYNKYFSQQYHFSTLSDKLLFNSEENFEYLLKTIGYTLLIFDDFISLMKIEIDQYSERLKSINQKFLDLYQNV